MTSDSIRHAIIKKIDMLDEMDVTFIVIFGGLIGFGCTAILGVLFLMAFQTAPYALLGVLTVTIIGGILWRITSINPTQSVETDPIGELQEQYARGEITEQQFDHRMQKLMDTEDVTLETEELISELR